MFTTVLADCPTCEMQTDCKIVDCDDCWEKYGELGGDPALYKPEVECEHLECTRCGFPV